MSQNSPFEALTREQLIERLDMEVWASARPRIARHLADQVMTLLKINPKGIDLVMWFADARHPTNAPAMADWIGRQMDDPVFKEASQETPPLMVLAGRVSGLLEKAEAANS